MFNFRVPINRDYILNRVAEEDIFQRYLGIKPQYNVVFCNPLREDKSPGCTFYVNSDGRIKFKDHSWGFNWDCFNVVEYLYKINFSQALKRVAIDFGLTDGQLSDPTVNRREVSKDKLELRISRRGFSQEDYEFWTKRYGLTDSDLKEAYIYPIEAAWFVRNGILEQIYAYRKGNPGYAYHFGGYDYKLYFPFKQKGNKFIQSRGDIIQGLQLLPTKGHICLITKSYKDVTCINKYGKAIQVKAVASMSESQLIPSHIIHDLNLRFDYLFTLLDFDRTGIRAAKDYEEIYGIKPLFFGPEYKGGKFIKGINSIKDFSDHIEFKGVDKTIELTNYAYEQLINS